MVDDSKRHRTNRRTYIKGVAGAAGIAAFAGCTGGDGGSQETSTTESGGTTEKTTASKTTTTKSGGSSGSLKFGFTSYVRGGSWITAYVEAAKFYAQDQGIQLDVRPNRQSSTKQIQDIRDFANKGYDGIMVGVWQTGAAESAINYAMDQGVPVMSTNADTSSSKIPLYVGFSNYSGGKTSGEQMVKALKEQYPNKDSYHVLNVRGIQGNQSANQRSQGFLDVMKKHDNITVDKTINGKYAQDVAQNKTQQYINANGTPDGIYSGNLSMGLGVHGALKNLGKLHKKGEDGHIVLTQMDGSPQVNPLVGQGFIDAAVDQPNYFYNPIAMKYLKMYVEAGGVDGGGDSVIPKPDTTVTKDQFSISSGQHKGIEMWSKQIWSPAPIKTQNGHPWLQTNSIVITQENYDKPYLWGNVWGNK